MTKTLYDIAKWASLVALPALAVLVHVVGPVWGLENVDRYVVTIVASGVFIGSLVGVSSSSHTARVKAENETLDLYQPRTRREAKSLREWQEGDQS